MSYTAQFTLSEAPCLLNHKNDRIEKHGEEDVLACDLSISYETSNDILAMFAPALKSSLYMRSDSAQGSLVPDQEHLTALRFPALCEKPLKWAAGELFGAEVKFHHGISSKSDVVFQPTKVTKFKLECLEGGTVIVHFLVQVNPTDAQTSFLSKVLRDKVCTISVTPLAAES